MAAGNVVASALPKNIVLFVVLSAVLSIGSFLIVEFYDYDIWWHLVIGKDILGRLAVPVTDHFSEAGFGRPYHDSHWLFQVVAAAAEMLAGFPGITVLVILLWTATFYFLYRSIRQWVEPAGASVLLFLAAMASIERFIPRPELVTFLMIAFFSLRLQQGKFRSTPDRIILALAQIIWTNCHGLFIFGPLMVGCYWLVEAGYRIRGKTSQAAPLGLLFVLLLAVTLINPYGFKSWEYALLLFTELAPAGQPVMKRVLELAPTFGSEARSAPAFWFFLFLLISAAAGAVFGVIRRRISPARLLIAIAMLAAAVTARRNIVLFAIVAAPLTAENFHAALQKFNTKWARTLLLSIGLMMVCWTWFPLSGSYYHLIRTPARFGFGATPSFFPFQLMEFLEKRRLDGTVFNSNNVGGFYLYHFYPSSLPLVDGRFEVYSDATHALLAGVLDGDPEAFREIVMRYNVNYVLMMHGSPEARQLVPKLVHDPAWRLVYYDYAASFWMKSDMKDAPPAADLSVTAPLPEPERIEDCTLLDQFLIRTGSPGLRLRNLQRGLQFGLFLPYFLRETGSLQVQRGNWQEAERTFTDLLREAPHDMVALNELSRIAYNRGDLRRAEKLLKQAVDLYPDNESLKRNYLLIIKSMRQ